MAHELPKLNYAYDALEPFIDIKTMEIHYTKHHQTYVNNLNAALEKHIALSGKPVDTLLRDLTKVPEEIRTIVRNNGGGHWNHSFFWKLLKKDVPAQGEVASMITAQWGSLETFKEAFTKAALGRFGSGWVWLVLHNNKLEIVSTPNQDSPLMGSLAGCEGTPLLGLDVWEHAYYLKYQNRRNEYIAAFLNIINWKQVDENYTHR